MYFWADLATEHMWGEHRNSSGIASWNVLILLSQTLIPKYQRILAEMFSTVLCKLLRSLDMHSGTYCSYGTDTCRIICFTALDRVNKFQLKCFDALDQSLILLFLNQEVVLEHEKIQLKCFLMYSLYKNATLEYMVERIASKLPTRFKKLLFFKASSYQKF